MDELDIGIWWINDDSIIWNKSKSDKEGYVIFVL